MALVAGMTGAGCTPLRPPAASPPTPATVAPTVGATRRDTTARRAADSARAPLAPGAPVVSPVEIRREAVAVFGDSAPFAMVDVPATNGPAEPTWDIDVRTFATNERVAHYVQLFAGDAKERFTRRLSRGTRYDAMIRARLRAGGIPEDMTFLALIESGYDPDAYSRAAAVGMWQFMSSTARGVGLRVDWWVDERRDPIRSTDGAVRFLNYLRKQFGSLFLAAAAYNGGPGRVARGLVRYSDDLEGTTGDSLFFALAETDYLRRETRDYVPQLVAAAIVGKASARYGLLPDSLPPFQFDTVRVPASTPLAAVAVASAAPLAVINDLNRHLLRGMTPPDGPSLVRVPVGRAPGLGARLDALDDSLRRAFTRVTTRKGETLAHLAATHRLTVRELGWYNRKIARNKKGTLVTGQVIMIPTAAVIAGARDVPDPGIEKWGRPSRSGVRTHVVKAGETLGSIARHFGTTSAAIMKLNRLKTKLIVPGQALVVRGGRRGQGSTSSKQSGKARAATKAKAKAKAKAKT